MAAGARHPRLADRQHEVVELRHLEALAVENFVLQEHHRAWIADRRLEQALGVGGGVRRDHLEPGHMGVPGRVVLAVLRGDAGGSAVRPAEHDRAMHLAARHIERLGGRVDDVVDRLHGEVPGHELDDRLEPGEGRADADAGEAIFGDRRVDHARRAELVEQALGHFIGALVLADLLAHDEHAGSRRISSAMASRSASRTVMLTISVPGRDFGFGARFGRRVLRAGRRLLDIGQALAELRGAASSLTLRGGRRGLLRVRTRNRCGWRLARHREERPQAASRRR